MRFFNYNDRVINLSHVAQMHSLAFGSIYRIVVHFSHTRETLWLGEFKSHEDAMNEIYRIVAGSFDIDTAVIVNS